MEKCEQNIIPYKKTTIFVVSYLKVQHRKTQKYAQLPNRYHLLFKTL